MQQALICGTTAFVSTAMQTIAARCETSSELVQRCQLQVKKTPTSEAAYVDLATAYATAGNIEKTVEAYRQGYKQPGTRSPEYYRAYINNLNETGEQIEANRLAQECLKAYPNSAIALMAMSYQCMLEKKFKDAIEMAKKAERLLPPGTSLLRFQLEGALGVYYYDDKQWSQALPYLRRALEHSPSFQLHFQLGRCLHHTGHDQEALQELDKAQLMSRHNKDICLARIEFFEDTHQYAKAIAEANSLLRLVKYEVDKDLLTARCRLYQLNGQTALAKKDKALLMKLDSGMSDLFSPSH